MCICIFRKLEIKSDGNISVALFIISPLKKKNDELSDYFLRIDINDDLHPAI